MNNACCHTHAENMLKNSYVGMWINCISTFECFTLYHRQNHMKLHMQQIDEINIQMQITYIYIYLICCTENIYSVLVIVIAHLFLVAHKHTERIISDFLLKIRLICTKLQIHMNPSWTATAEHVIFASIMLWHKIISRKMTWKSEMWWAHFFSLSLGWLPGCC